MKNHKRLLILLFLLMATSAVLTEADPSAGSRQALYQDNVVIVLDASGSMKENISGTNLQKMDVAKSALWEVLKEVPNTTNIGLLVFSGVNVTEDWVYPLGPRDNNRLFEAINLPQPGSGTPLGQYIKKGADALLQQREKQYGYGSYRLLIVTDGEATDKNLVNKYTPDVLSRGIIVDVIGVDMKEDHILATKVHSYRKADDPDSLREAISQVFAEVTSQGTDTASGEAFEILRGIPNELANEMITALSSSGNYPIGAKPFKGKLVGEEETRSTDSGARAGSRIRQNSGASFPIWIIIPLGVIMLFFLIIIVRRLGIRKTS